MAPDPGRVRFYGKSVHFPGPETARSLGPLLGVAVLASAAVAPLGWAAVVPLWIVFGLLLTGALAEEVRHRGWRLEQRLLRRDGFGGVRPVSRLILDGGPGEPLVLRADDQVLCRTDADAGGLERMEVLAERVAVESGLTLDDRRPWEHWQRWRRGERGMAVLAWRLQQSTAVHGPVPPASEPAGVRWEHDRCEAVVAGVPVVFDRDDVVIGNRSLPVGAFRRAAVIRRREGGLVVVRIAYVVGEGVHEVLSALAERPEHAGQVRWVLERIQERIVDRGRADEVPAAIRGMRETLRS